ncbi:MAG: MFS transporter [Henriciella sp.]
MTANPSTTAQSGASLENDAPRYNAMQGWWAVFVLFIAYALAFIDRTIISLLVGPMKADFGLTDTQISLLQGIAFTLFYATLAYPIATFSDRKNRPLIIGLGVFVWSLMTTACGFAANFVQLFLARMGVGVGEATLGPAALSLVADLFPPERRGRAMAVLSCGISIGGGLAFILGGYIVGLVTADDMSVPFLDGLSSWRVVFILVGLPGILAALLFITIPEPRSRRKAETVEPEPKQEKSVPILPFLKTKPVQIISLFFGFSISGLLFLALMSWGPTWLHREFGASFPQAGKLIGWGLLIFGPIGAILGGWLADWGIAHSRKDSPYWVGFVGVLFMALCGIASILAPTFLISGWLIAAALFFGSFAYPAGASAVQAMAPGPIRARFAALYLFTVTMISATLGPTIVAVLTDYVFGDPARIGDSITWTILLTAPLGLIACAVGARQARSQPE